jgi:uncharacterized membrane protein YkoI
MNTKKIIPVLGAGILFVQSSLAQNVNYSDLPPAVQQTVNAQAGGGEITAINRLNRNGVPLYEVRLGDAGARPLYISETGSLIQPDNVIGSRRTRDSSRKGTFQELPPAVQTAVRNQAGTARIDDIDIVTRNGQTNYNVAFKRDGNNVELRVDPAGNVSAGGHSTAVLSQQHSPSASPTRVALSASTKVTLKDVPAAVQNTLRSYTGGAEIEDIDRGTVQGKTVYEAAFKHNNQHQELRVAEDGSLVRDDVNDRYLAAIGRTPGASATPAAAAAARVPLSGSAKVSFRDLPDPVRDAIRHYAGITRIEDIDRGTLNGRTVYQAAFKSMGEHVELRVAEDGSLVNDDHNQRFLADLDRQAPAGAVGRAPSWQVLRGSGSSGEVQFQQLPGPVQTTLRSQAGASAIRNITQSSVNGKTVFQATVERGGRPVQIQVAEDGSMVP